MILSGFLSRQKQDNSNQHEIVPVSFNMQNIYYNLHIIMYMKEKKGKYLAHLKYMV